MVRRYLQQYHESLPSTAPPRPGLRQIKLQPGVSHYLYHDTKNASVLRARLRFDVNGLQMGAIATRIFTSLISNPHTDRAAIADLSQQKQCQLCGQKDADHRYHLLVQCPALETYRRNLDLDLTIQQQEHRKAGSGYHHGSSSLRINKLKCTKYESLQLFLLGELNCPNAVIQSSYTPQQ